MISVEVFAMRNSLTTVSNKVFTTLIGLLIVAGSIVTLSSCRQKTEILQAVFRRMLRLPKPSGIS